MTVEPHSGRCSLCGAPVIDAGVLYTDHTRVILDPKPAANGPWRAHLTNLLEWRAAPAVEGSEFLGSRRAEHVCLDVQLEL
jgi:hypothetical protein